jgi:glycosyltransferase involved in cell wall biosynthesis
MKIAYDCRLLQKAQLTDGASRYAYELLSSLMEVDSSLQLFFLGYSDEFKLNIMESLLKKGGHFVPAFKRNKSTMLNFVLTQLSYPKILRKYQIDLFHGLFQTDTLLFTNTPQILTVHDLGPYYSHNDEVRKRIEKTLGIYIKKRLQDALRFKFIKKARVVLADSEFTRRRLIELEFARPDNIKVVYLGLNTYFERCVGGEDILEHYGISKPYLFMVGRIQPYKNILGAIKAFKILTDRNLFDGILLVAGTAKSSDERNYLEKCIEQAEVYGLSGKVRFLGYVPDSHLKTLYSKVSVFLQASFLEGFGFPPLEAASSGTPVVISEIGSLPEVMPQAVKVSPFDPVDIAEGLNIALKSGRGEKIRWNNWMQTAKKVIEVYSIAKNMVKE